MPQYAVIISHPPNVCPMSSKGARESAMRAYAILEEAGKKHGVKVVLDLHLDPNHKAFMLFESPSADILNKTLMEGGFPYFAEMEFHFATPIQELLKQMDKFPVVYP